MTQQAAASSAEHRSRVTQRSLILIGVAAAFLVVLLALAVGWSYASTRDKAHAEARSVLLLMANQAGRLLDSADLVLSQMIGIAQETDWEDEVSAQRARDWLLRLRQQLPAAQRLFIWDSEGRNLAHSLDGLSTDTTAVGREYFTAQRDGNPGLFVSNLLIALIDSTPIFALSRRVSDQDGDFAGVVSLSLEPAVLGDFYRDLEFRRDAVFTWLHEDGHILVHEPPVPVESLLASAAAQELAAAIRRAPVQGQVSYPSPLDGAVRTTFYRKVRGYPLYVAVGIADAELRRSWVEGIALQMAVSLLALCGLGYAGHRTLRWAREEDSYRTALADLNRRLRKVNSELEQRVEERTASLSEALEKKDLLFRELNHRVKNSLQLVMSLLQMHARSSDSAEARAELGEAVTRIAAIARMHERLYRADGIGSVDVAGYLAAITADLEQQSTAAAGHPWKIELLSDPLQLPTDQAVPLALITNELITNAFKHAQPDSDEQAAWTLHVRLVRLADGGLRLSVRDHGPGLANPILPEPGGSLGMTLIRGMAQQLQGTLEIEHAAPGTRFVVSVPASG